VDVTHGFRLDIRVHTIEMKFRAGVHNLCQISPLSFIRDDFNGMAASWMD